jgi:phage-related baseplate assembly protein
VSTLFDAVDLGGLPAPQVVETLDYETILAAMTADLVARHPEFDALVESDPALKVLQVAAYRELILRARVNDAAKSVLLAFATGSDLDHLAALFGLARLTVTAADPEAIPPRAAVLETDTALRRRVQLSLEAATAAGTAGRYLFYALGASALVADASVTSPTPGQVLITVLSTVGDGTPDAGLLAAVDAVVQHEDVRQLCDRVTVAAAQLVPWSIEARLFYRPGAAAGAARAAALAKLDALLAEPARLGRTVARSAIFAALHVEGVSRVELIAPAADIAIGATQAAAVGAVSVTDG